MISGIHRISKAAIAATDGSIGHVKEAYFDDQTWTIRYLVVDTGTWLSGREVLVSPYAVVQPLPADGSIAVRLTRQQIKDSPSVDTHQPVSRRHEREHLAYYTFPQYWEGTGLWFMSGFPLVPAPLPDRVETEAEIAARDAGVAEQDFHLRGTTEVEGYDIQASDDSIGHVTDFLFDDETWSIRYLVVDTRNWWPGGRKVLLATSWIENIDWADRTVFTSLTRDEVQGSPVYDEKASSFSREDEVQLHKSVDRAGYWDM